jgi:dTDP-4-amino-4,6-dideoxygalactose transaminase
MTAAGVGVAIHYPTPVHLTGAYAGVGFCRGQFPVAETAADRILSLPIFPHLRADQQEVVVAVLEEAVRATRDPADS